MKSFYTPLAQEFLSFDKSQPGPGDIYERFYNWLLNQGLTREQAEGEVATFMETVADLMD